MSRPAMLIVCVTVTVLDSCNTDPAMLVFRIMIGDATLATAAERAMTTAPSLTSILFLQSSKGCSFILSMTALIQERMLSS